MINEFHYKSIYIIFKPRCSCTSFLSAETESMQQEKPAQTKSPRMLNTILTLIGQTDGLEETV